MSEHTSGKEVSDNDPSVQNTYNTYKDDRTGQTNIVTTNDEGDKNPHTHEVIGSDHVDVTDPDGNKTDKVVTNAAHELNYTIKPDDE